MLHITNKKLQQLNKLASSYMCQQINLDDGCLEKQSKFQNYLHSTYIIHVKNLKSHKPGAYSIYGYICMWSGFKSSSDLL